MLHILILMGAFLTVSFLTVGLYYSFRSSRMAVLERLKFQTREGDALAQAEASRSRGFKGDFLAFLGMLGNMVPRRSNMKSIQQKLVQAHVLLRAEEFVGLVILAGVAGFLFLYLLTTTLLVAVPGGLLFMKVPSMLVEMRKDKRMKALTEQLAEGLTIISNGLRAGFSFPQAMGTVSREMEPPIAEEFGRVVWENRMGKSFEEALHNLQERTDCDDLNLLITALLIHKQVGGNLAEILDNISHTIRERIRLQGEIRTLTTEGRVSAIIVLLLPFGVAGAVLVLNPDYILTLVREQMGFVMIGLALVLQILGIIFIRRIVDIEV